MNYTHYYDSPLGSITMTSQGAALTGLWFEGQRSSADMLSDCRTDPDLPVFGPACRWLDLYFSGRDPGFTPPLLLRGTAFRRAVWDVLLTIPRGRTMTYGEIAEQIAVQTGVPRMSAQAVGGAVGHNPVLLIVPCHRVIGSGSSLTGYAGGIEKKRKLLLLEQEGIR